MPKPPQQPTAWYAVVSGVKVLVMRMTAQEALHQRAAGCEIKAFATKEQARAEAMTWEGRLSDAFG